MRRWQRGLGEVDAMAHHALDPVGGHGAADGEMGVVGRPVAPVKTRACPQLAGQEQGKELRRSMRSSAAPGL